MEPNVSMGCPEKGIACSLNPFKHEQYPSNNLNQNNQPMMFTMYLNEGVTFPLGFVKVT
jgi:hypothetical protein